VVFGIDGTDATRAVLMSGSSPRNIDGYWFAAVSEIPEGSRIDFRASVTPAQIAIAAVFGLFLLGLMIMIPIGLWRKSAAVARSPQLDREALQQRYDRAKPAWMMLLPAMALPFLLIAGTQRLSLTRAIGNVISFSPVPIGAVMAVLGVACFGSLALSTVLMRKRAAQVRSETGGTAPAQTSARISLAFLPIFVVAFCVLLLQMAPVYSSQGLRYRLYALIGLLAAAIVTSLVLARRQAKAMRAVLREGPWFDMVQELSVTAGVRVRAVTLLDLPAANAYATAFQTIGLTRGLIEQLEPAEVRAVIAHEMAHLKLGHPQRTLWVSLAISSLVYGGFAAVSGSIAAHLGREAADLARNPILFFLPLNIVVLLLTGRGRRRRELEADRLASRWIGDPELVAAALTRVHELNASPYRLKKSDEAISTHPSLEKRLAALKENGDK
jgi:heat shock protein HtpX